MPCQNKIHRHSTRDSENHNMAEVLQTPVLTAGHIGIPSENDLKERTKRKFAHFEEDACKIIQNAWRRRFQYQTLKYKVQVFQQLFSSHGHFMKFSAERIKQSIKMDIVFKMEKMFTLHFFKAISVVNPGFKMEFNAVPGFIIGFLIANEKDCFVSQWSKVDEELKNNACDMVRHLEEVFLHIENNGALHEQSIRKTVSSLCNSIETYDSNYKRTQKHHFSNMVKRFKFDIFVKAALCIEYENFKKQNCFVEIRDCKKTIQDLFAKFTDLFPCESADFSCQLASKNFDYAEDLEHYSTSNSLLSAWDLCEPEIAKVGKFNIDHLGHELVLDFNFSPSCLSLKGCFTANSIQLQKRFENYCFHAISQELSGMHVSEVPFYYTYTKLYRIRQWLAQIIPLEFAAERDEIIKDFLIPVVLRDLINEECHWSDMVFLLEKNIDMIFLVNISEEQKDFFLTEWTILKNAMLNCSSDLHWPSMVAHAIEWIYNGVCSIHETFIVDMANMLKPRVELDGLQLERESFKNHIVCGSMSNNKLIADISIFLEERFTVEEKKLIMRGKNPDLKKKCNVLLLVKYLFEPVPPDSRFKDILPDSLLMDIYSLLELRSTMRFILFANNIMTRLVSFEKSIDDFEMVSIFSIC